MAKKVSRFLIGIFVTIGILIAVVTLILLGATSYFQEGAMYVTYFDESVQGLQVDSSVKYRGVEIGKVKAIGVAPDNMLIEVVMKINQKGVVAADTTAQLRAAGITGIVFVELDRRKADAGLATPRIGFKAPYPIIPSRPSDAKQFFSGVDALLDKIRALDVQGMSGQLSATAGAIKTFFNGPKTNRILANLEATTTTLDRVLAQLDRVTAQSTLDDTVKEARATLTEARELITAMKKEVRAVNLAETSGKANQWIEGLDRRTRDVTTDLKVTSENVRQASESLDRLLDRLEANPSDLLFSKPPRVPENP